MDHPAQELATVFGGSGFVGTQVVQLLAQAGYRIRVAVRRPELAGHLRPLGNVGQIVPMQANVRSAASVARAVAGADVVINLVGIGFERGSQRFATIHVEGAGNIARAAAAAGARALVHMSVLGADPDSESDVSRSRAAGEAAVFAAYPQAVVLRPSIMFGQGDGFFNLMGSLARLFPVLPLIGGRSRFQPVYVRDVAQAFLNALRGVVETGRVYELGGPEIETYKQLMQRILRETERTRLLLPVPAGLAKLMAAPMSILPTPLLTADQVVQLQSDNIVSEAAIRDGRTFAAFNIAPTAMEAVLPSYMWRFRPHGQFDGQPA